MSVLSKGKAVLPLGTRMLAADTKATYWPSADTIRPMPYLALQRSKDAGFPSGWRHYWQSAYLKHLSDEAIEVLLRLVAAMPSEDSGVGLQQLHGVASRVPP